MSKRKAEYDIEPPLEKKVKTPSKSSDNHHNNHNESPTKIINKVTPSKNLTPSKESISKTSDNKKTPTKDLLVAKPQDSKKVEDKPKPSLFANLLTVDSAKTTEKKTLFFGNLLNQAKSDPSTNDLMKPKLFSTLLESKPIEGGIFSSFITEKKEGGSLFGALPKEGGIFGSQKKEEGSLFGSSKGGLFSSGVPSNGQGMFTSRFSQQGKELLTLDKFKSTSKESDDEDGNDDGEDYMPKSPQINALESSGNYTYDDNFKKIIQKIFHKAKVNDKSSENGTVALEEAPNKSILLVLRNQAKLIMEQGIILKKFTKIGTINKSSNGLQALVYKQENGKLTKHLFKILFCNNNDCGEFKTELEKHI